MNDQSNQNTRTNWKVSILVPIIVAIIGGISTIIASIAGNDAGEEKAVSEVINQATNTVNVNVNSIDELITMYSQLSIDNSNLKDENLKLEKENNFLIGENESLKSENKIYSSSAEDITALLVENESLENEITELRSEIQTLKNNNQEQETQNESDSLSSDIQTGNKVSIFDMDTFQGKRGWEIPEFETEYTDTYNNVYKTSRKAEHSQSAPDELYHVPTYLLNYKYSECEGQIAWPKKSKDASGDIWIDFYSNGKLIFSTDHISATDKTITFNFSVKDLETLTVVRNSNRPDTTPSIYVIYPYLNLVE